MADLITLVAAVIVLVAFCVGAYLRSLLVGLVLAGIAGMLVGLYPGEVTLLFVKAVVLLALIAVIL
jgi:hypothetical protein